MAKWPYNTAQWQKLRMAKLAQDPLCYPCSLRCLVVTAVVVDHVKPINAGGAPFPPLNQLMSCCERCHNEKTAANDRSYSKPFSRNIKGFDLDGNPIDPGDDWHGGGGHNHENASGQGPTAQLNKYLVSEGDEGEDASDQGFA